MEGAAELGLLGPLLPDEGELQEAFIGNGTGIGYSVVESANVSASGNPSI